MDNLFTVSLTDAHTHKKVDYELPDETLLAICIYIIADALYDYFEKTDHFDSAKLFFFGDDNQSNYGLILDVIQEHMGFDWGGRKPSPYDLRHNLTQSGYDVDSILRMKRGV